MEGEQALGLWVLLTVGMVFSFIAGCAAAGESRDTRAGIKAGITATACAGLLALIWVFAMR